LRGVPAIDQSAMAQISLLFARLGSEYMAMISLLSLYFAAFKDSKPLGRSAA
jgi:hypothetical protein